MESFYGGHPGQSMVLKATFKSEQEMADAFAQGRNYTDVWYGEYCIISTPNINDVENGRVFRRGLDTTARWGGAEYIGQFVGPSSGTPFFNITSWDNVDEIFQEKKQKFFTDKNAEKGTDYEYPSTVNERYRYFPDNYTKDDDFDLTEIWGDGKTSEGSSEKIFDENVNLKAQTVDVTNGLVPGSKNPEIKYHWFNVRSNNQSSDSWIHVGFQIPYTEFSFAGNWTSPYDGDGNIKTSETGVTFDKLDFEKIDGKINPFLSKWQVNIPKGIKGDNVRNLRIGYVSGINTVSDKSDLSNPYMVYNWSDIMVSETTGIINYKDVFSEDGNTITAKSTVAFDSANSTNKAQVLIYDVWAYDNRAYGQRIPIYIGLIRNIKDIDWNMGVITIAFTDGTTKTIIIDYIQNVEIDTNTGVPSYTHSVAETTGSTKNRVTYGNPLSWVKDLYVADDGKIWLKKTTNDASIQTTIKVNGKDITETQLSDTGNAPIKYIKDLNIDDNNTLNIIFNTDEKYSHFIKAISSIYQNNYNPNLSRDLVVTRDSSIIAEYNDGTKNTIGYPINDIADVFVDGTNYHLYILYSDITQRPQSNDDLNKDKFASRNWATNVTVGRKDVFGNVSTRWDNSGVLYWLDLGAIKDQAGLLVGYHLTNSIIHDTAATLTADDNFNPNNYTKEDSYTYNINEIITYLNKVHPGGVTSTGFQPSNVKTESKIVTYSPGKTDAEQQKFFAYDYNRYSSSTGVGKGWYYLGSLDESTGRDVAIWENGEGSLDKLRTEGLAFITGVNEITATIPTPWRV